MSTSIFNAGIAYADFRQRRTAYILAACVAFLMSSYFIVGYLAGDLLVWHWSASQWLNGIVAVGLTAVMTAYQFILYSQGDISGGKKATVLAVCVAVGFSLLSEIGQGMERDNIRMETKSVESPTYKAIVSSISAGSTTAPPYSAERANAEMKLARCQQKVADGVWKDCIESKARVDAVNGMISQQNQASQSQALALAATAKTMEKDVSNYHPLVNLIRETIGASGTVASFCLSLILISFFEYAFHYLGGRYAESKELLLSNGYDVTRNQRLPPRQLMADGRPTRPIQQTAKWDDDSEQITRIVERGQMPGNDSTEGLHARVDSVHAYQIASDAPIGALVDCPQCGASFKKRNQQHRFCKKEHRFDWHNANDPEKGGKAA